MYTYIHIYIYTYIHIYIYEFHQLRCVHAPFVPQAIQARPESGDSILAATLLVMNFTSCGVSMPYSLRRRSRPTQNSGESILAATLLLMNVTSCGASMFHSVRKRFRPAQNAGELILFPTPQRERSVLRCLWLKPNLVKFS